MDALPLTQARSVSDASDIPTVEDTASVVTNAAVETDSIASVRDSSVSSETEEHDADHLGVDGVSSLDSTAKPTESGELDKPLEEESSERNRSESSDVAMCRICGQGAEEGPLYHPCRCSGSIAYVHEQCLRRWLAMRRTMGYIFRLFFYVDCSRCGHLETPYLRLYLTSLAGTGRTDDDNDGTFILEDQRCELCGHKFSFRVV